MKKGLYLKMDIQFAVPEVIAHYWQKPRKK